MDNRRLPALCTCTPKQRPAPDVTTQILKLIEDECKYWHGRDEVRRGGYAILLANAKELISKQQESDHD